jgi:uncharacterized protein YuzE
LTKYKRLAILVQLKLISLHERIRKFASMETKKLKINYDAEADVLYISFQRPQRATDSEMLENGILLRYSRDRLVGVTVLDASTRTYN